MEKQTKESSELFENNTDFQEEIEQNTDTNLNESDGESQSDNIVIVDNESQSDNIGVVDSESQTDCNMALNENSTNTDIANENEQTTLVQSQIGQESTQEIEDKNCTINRKQDEMIKNIMTYTCIPFILAAIILSIFNINKMKFPYSFLLLGLGLLDISICSFVRSKKLTLNCKCKNCLKQSKSAFKLSLFLLLTAVGLFIAFICLMVL